MISKMVACIAIETVLGETRKQVRWVELGFLEGKDYCIEPVETQ